MAFLLHCMELGITTVRMVTADSVKSFVNRYEDCSATYQRHIICVLRKVLIANGNTVMLTLNLKVRGYARKRVDWLIPAETERVFQTEMTPQEAFIVGSGFLQAMRKVEILRMTAKDAKEALSTGVLRIRGKGHKQREIPLHDDYADILRGYLISLGQKKDDERLLPYSPSWAEVLLDRFCKKYGRRFTFHTMRRTCGRNLWLIEDAHGRRIVPIETISEYLGHSSTDTTRRYLGINLSDMRQALSCYKVARKCTLVKNLARPVG